MGIECATGRWLLFSDADDWFADGAFDLFLSRVDSDADIIYTCMSGWNEETDLPCNRGEVYTRLIEAYLQGRRPEEAVRYQFHSPCCKLIRKELVDKHHLRFSEVKTGNDALFSVMSGYWAKKIEVVDRVTYVATVSGSNISRRQDWESVLCRYKEDLKINRFLRQHGQWRWQLHILSQLKARGWRKRIKMLRWALRYRQPLLVDYYTHVKW